MQRDEALGHLAHEFVHQLHVGALDLRQAHALENFLAQPPAGIGGEELQLPLDIVAHFRAKNFTQRGEASAFRLLRRIG